MMEDVSFDSELFTVKRLAEGVYALIEREDLTGSNAGIIDLGNKSIVFDTFLNIDAASVPTKELHFRPKLSLSGKMARSSKTVLHMVK